MSKTLNDLPNLENPTEVEENYTHRVRVNIYSREDDPNITIKVEFDPIIAEEDIESDNLPASYMMYHDFIHPAIEEAYQAMSVDPLMEMEPGSNRVN